MPAELSPTDSFSETGSGLPACTRWLFAFQFLNAVNFTMAIGAPMVLLAKHLGAGEGLVGVFISLTPFMALLQIVAAPVSARWGYRRMMLTGWRTRAWLLLVLVPVPLLVGRLSSSLLLGIFLAVLLGYNLSRGFASGSWLPWLAELIPSSHRGRYFGAEQWFINGGVLAAMIISGLLLGADARGWKYSCVIAVASISGIASASFLGRVPGGQPITDSERIDWKQLGDRLHQAWRLSLFRANVRYAFFYNLAMAAFSGFLIVYLRDQVHLSERMILSLGAAATLGAMLTARVIGRLADRMGSRPMMRLAALGQVLVLTVWTLMAWHWLECNLILVGTLYILSGIFVIANGIPQVRLLLATCPEEIRTEGMTLYQVLVSLACGMSPLVWGMLLELIRHGTGQNPYPLFFGGTLVLVLAAHLLLTRVREPEARPTVEVAVAVFWEWPQRLLSELSFKNHQP